MFCSDPNSSNFSFVLLGVSLGTLLMAFVSSNSYVKAKGHLLLVSLMTMDMVGYCKIFSCCRCINSCWDMGACCQIFCLFGANLFNHTEHSKNLLVECVASHLKHKKFTTTYGSRLDLSSGKILLQSVPGTELYRERFVRALARDLQVPLLNLDSSVLAPYDFGEDNSENESEDEGEETTLESEVENEASNEEEWTSSGESRLDDEDIEARAEETLKKLVPEGLEEFAKVEDGHQKARSSMSPEVNTEVSKEENLKSNSSQPGGEDLNEVNISMDARRRRPEISRRKVSYKHHDCSTNSESVMLSSQEILQDDIRNSPTQDSKQESVILNDAQDEKLAVPATMTENRLNELFDELISKR
ncbi:hypothetical protein L6452_34879 [Arctium lappa]|uniref:Uncharacterized protein n=1 Tax=Arctium lappa TaxID=4217 RepID=A0ACB8YK02_ARCLA|nr:hypothetical protein L6452_34879 [Arctium lappa]